LNYAFAKSEEEMFKQMKLRLIITIFFIVAVSGVFSFVVVEAHTRTINIKVDKNGFSPSSTVVTTGHRIKMVFNRADDENCAKEIVFLNLNLRKPLPIRKDVIVYYSPTAAGELTFSCGTGKYKGSLLVRAE
jgi:plastocyanin domain-containing protein